MRVIIITVEEIPGGGMSVKVLGTKSDSKSKPTHNENMCAIYLGHLIKDTIEKEGAIDLKALADKPPH